MFGLNSDFLFYIPGLLLALTVHEFAHSWISYHLGDPTPKLQGRLSFNPLNHIDPIGFIMMVLFRFGWCKPVEVNPFYYKNRRQGMLMVALAGPAANFLTALLVAVLYGLLTIILPASLLFNSYLIKILLGILMYNVNLGLFNLIPIPPLDGSKVLEGLLPVKESFAYMNFMNRYGLLILLAVMITGAYRYLISPLANLFLNALLAIVQMFI
ncbi:MAG: site-2 protease family protein [Negativicutes bacterium]|nr:site-2 protease family protein [Negativicutes bacterium]